MPSRQLPYVPPYNLPKSLSDLSKGQTSKGVYSDLSSIQIARHVDTVGILGDPSLDEKARIVNTPSVPLFPNAEHPIGHPCLVPSKMVPIDRARVPKDSVPTYFSAARMSAWFRTSSRSFMQCFWHHSSYKIDALVLLISQSSSVVRVSSSVNEPIGMVAIISICVFIAASLPSIHSHKLAQSHLFASLSPAESFSNTLTTTSDVSPGCQELMKGVISLYPYQLAFVLPAFSTSGS